MSLPRLFRTELNTVPFVCPYLKAPTQPKEALRVVCPPGGISVGLVWASNPENKAMYRNKSLPLALLMPLFERLIDLDLMELHSLQFGVDAEQIAPWRHRQEIHEWNDRLTDFSDTAQLLHQLDLVITVDTAVAHLAGVSANPLVAAASERRLPLAASRSDSPGILRCASSANTLTVIGSQWPISSVKRSTACFCLIPSPWTLRGWFDA